MVALLGNYNNTEASARLMHDHIRAGRGHRSRRQGRLFLRFARQGAGLLFGPLNKIPGKDAFLALEEILRSHPEVETHLWFAHLAR